MIRWSLFLMYTLLVTYKWYRAGRTFYQIPHSHQKPHPPCYRATTWKSGKLRKRGEVKATFLLRHSTRIQTQGYPKSMICAAARLNGAPEPSQQLFKTMSPQPHPLPARSESLRAGSALGGEGVQPPSWSLKEHAGNCYLLFIATGQYRFLMSYLHKRSPPHPHFQWLQFTCSVEPNWKQ